jgi:transposase, IS5 family
METYLRLMFLKFRYRLGHESLCREVADSISWRRFARISLGGRVPHPTTLMKITTRCGEGAVGGLNETLLAKAAGVKLRRTHKVRADTTVAPADVDYPTDSGLLAKAVATMGRTVRRVQGAGRATRTGIGIGGVRRVGGFERSLPGCGCVGMSPGRPPAGSPASSPSWPPRRWPMRRRCCATPGVGYATAVTPSAAGCAAAVDDLTELIERTARVVAQTRTRLAGGTRTGRAGWSACTTRTPGRSARAGWASRWSSATRPRWWTTPTASSSTTPSRSAHNRTHPS